MNTPPFYEMCSKHGFLITQAPYKLQIYYTMLVVLNS